MSASIVMIEKNHSFFLANFIIFSEACVPYKIVMIKNIQKPHSSTPKIPSINTMTSPRIIPICQHKSWPLCSSPLSWVFLNYFFNCIQYYEKLICFDYSYFYFVHSVLLFGRFLPPVYGRLRIVGLRTLKMVQKKYNGFKTICRPKSLVTSFSENPEVIR